jgi:hypothetical protein
MPRTGLTFTINREQLRGYSEILVSTTRLPVAEQLIPQISRHRSTARLQPLFIELDDVDPGLNKRERRDRHATFGGDAL